MKICVLGLGYIGLPTALLMAKSGFEVVGVDINEYVVESLKNGKLHFEEKGMEELFKEAGANFKPSTEVEEADVYVIAVPTPLDSSIKIANLAYIVDASRMIGKFIKKGDLVVVESTIPPGTSEKLVVPNLERNGLGIGDFYLAHTPERAIPGNTIHEMVNNERIIGGYDKKSCEVAHDIYRKFVKGKIHLTDIKTAELVKLMENTYRDVNIALANEFAKIGHENCVDIWEAIGLANRHPRVDILNPGPGVGGHCISVDPWFLSEISTSSKMVHLAREINDSMPNYVVKLVNELLGNIKKPTITIFGVAYKGNVDDVRESPAYKIIKLAENQGIRVKCHDPHVNRFEYDLYDLEEAVKDSDCIVIVTDHDIFKDIDPSKLKIENKNIVDTRNIIDKEKWIKAGFNVRTIGRGKDEFNERCKCAQ